MLHDFFSVARTKLKTFNSCFEIKFKDIHFSIYDWLEKVYFIKFAGKISYYGQNL